MDIEQPENDDNDKRPQNELVRARDILPDAIPILPQSERPFFPGQAIPMLVDSIFW